MLLVVRHDKEMEQVTRHNERLQKALEDRQRADRARLPKWQRNDGKLSMKMTHFLHFLKEKHANQCSNNQFESKIQISIPKRNSKK